MSHVYTRLPQLTAAIEQVTEISHQLTERKNEAVAEITGTFEDLERALHQRKTSLIMDLENICNGKQKVGVTHVHRYVHACTRTQARAHTFNLQWICFLLHSSWFLPPLLPLSYNFVLSLRLLLLSISIHAGPAIPAVLPSTGEGSYSKQQ